MARRRRKRPTKERACGEKKKFNKTDAIGAAITARKKGARMSAYRCPYKCKLPNGQNSWHIGHFNSDKRNGR